MNIIDALNILGLEAGTVTLDDAKMAYRRACSKYHPDRNPAGLEMMKAVNAAWVAVLGHDGYPLELRESKNAHYGDALNEALSAVIHLPDITIELCGAWVWLSGDTKPVKDVIKAAGFRWAAKKGRWYFRPPEFRSASRGKYSMDEIRVKYGSESVRKQERDKLVA